MAGYRTIPRPLAQRSRASLEPRVGTPADTIVNRQEIGKGTFGAAWYVTVPDEQIDGGETICLTDCEPLTTALAGECPERQKGRTVNPLADAFVGSSPTSPTIPGMYITTLAIPQEAMAVL